MSDWSVRFEGVSKSYRRGVHGTRTLGSLLRRGTPAATGGGRPPALSDVDLTVHAGEAYALVGPNGAGKTSALRLVARISRPTAGQVRVRGRVGALMEVGSGIHPELTARENIRLYGAILGLSRQTIERRFDDIVGFADLGHVVDQQVKYFSSGMQLRLGFSIAAHLEPDVFVIDEALAVGDVMFQNRCMERMAELVRSGTTLLFVSHNLGAVEGLCQRGVLLVGGRAELEGDVSDVVQRYLAHVEDVSAAATGQPAGSGPLRLVGASCHDGAGRPATTYRPGDPLELRLSFECAGPVDRPHVNIGITDGRPGLLVQCSTLLDGQAPERVEGRWDVTLRIAALPLRSRLYRVYCDVYRPDANGHYFPWTEVLTFRVEGERAAGPLAASGEHLVGPVLVDYEWA